jgi:phosphatidylethanolamine-binding protein (PEBP) family uncharacterized protein
MGLPPFVEGCLGTLLSSQKGRDAKLLTNTAPFTSFPDPTIPITSPDCGPSGSALAVEYTQLGSNRFPLLKWPAHRDVKEWLIIVEDPDAPLPSPIVHGLYLAIPGSVTEFGGENVDANGDVKAVKGYRVGKNRPGTVFAGPRPVLGHGVHRYMFDVIGLREPLVGLGDGATKEEVGKAIEGKVIGWGRWMGTFERRWE